MGDRSVYLLPTLKEIGGVGGGGQKGREERVENRLLSALLPTGFRLNQSDPNESSNTRSQEVFH